MRHLDWDDSGFALAVARAGSLSAAGRELGVHTATVARRVDRLEERLQATLFERTPTGLQPTSTGQRVVDSAARVEGEILQMRAATLADDRRVEGVVRLATAPLLARYLLAPAMPALQQRWPALSLDLVTRRERESLATGAIDLAFRLVVGGPPATPGMVARRVGTTTFQVFASAGYLEECPLPRPVRSLEGHRRIGYAEVADPAAPWLDSLTHAGRVVATSNMMPVVHALVMQGVGVAALLSFMPGRDSDLEPISGPLREAGLYVVMPPTHRDIARVRAVADWLAGVGGALDA